MNERARKVLPWVGYGAFYVLSLVVFAYVTIPYERIKHAMVSGFNARQASGLRMEIEDLGWSWRFPGIAATGIRWVPPSLPQGAAAPPETRIESAYLRLSILPMLTGTKKVGFGGDAFGGHIDGTATESSEEKSFTVSFDGVDAGQMPYLSGLVGGLPLAGSLDGAIDLALPGGRLADTEGTMELSITDFTVGDGKTKIPGLPELPKVRAGTLEIEADAEGGHVKVSKLGAKGPDLEIVADGVMRLGERIDTSVVELNLRFKFSDQYRGQSDATRALLGEPSSSVPGLFDLDPRMKRAKRADGFYGWRVTGPFRNLAFTPSPVATLDEPRLGSGSRKSSKLRGFSKRSRHKGKAERDEKPEQ